MDYDFPETAGNFISPTGRSPSFFRGVGIPPTRREYTGNLTVGGHNFRDVALGSGGMSARKHIYYMPAEWRIENVKLFKHEHFGQKIQLPSGSQTWLENPSLIYIYIIYIYTIYIIYDIYNIRYI